MAEGGEVGDIWKGRADRAGNALGNASSGVGHDDKGPSGIGGTAGVIDIGETGELVEPGKPGGLGGPGR